MPLERYDDKQIVLQFSSTHELLDFIENEEPNWTVQSSKKQGAGSSWDLGVSFNKAMELLRYGWEEGVKKASALAQPIPNHTRWTEKFDYAGEIPDVGRYLAGDPMHMRRRGASRKPKPAMTLAISIGANCNVHSTSMANYGAAMLALIDRLESKGVRVELYVLWATEGNKGRTSISVNLKRAQDVLDISAIAFGVAHPAMLRRIMFACIERTRQPYIPGYGSSSSLISEADMVAHVPGALYIGGIGRSAGACYSLSDALEYAKGQINRAAGAAIVELEEAV